MPDAETEDAELVAAAAHGDSLAFTLLVRRHIRSATLLAVQLLGDQDDADDIVQEAFTLVYQRAGEFKPAHPFPPWLFGIIRRLAANRLARDARHARLLRAWRTNGASAPVARTPAIDGAIDAKLDLEVVWRSLPLLSPMQRACFELVALRELSYEEVAAMHGISESTARQHVFRARQLLAEVVNGEGKHHAVTDGGERGG